MAERQRCILQVSTVDHRGGAARVAWCLHQAYRQRSLRAWMAVGHKLSDEETVLVIPNSAAKPLRTRVLVKVAHRLQNMNYRIRGAWRLGRVLHWFAEPRRQWDINRGVEDFHYPGTWRLLGLIPEVPDIIHCHNLHGGYFDLRALPWLSQRLPVVLTLHDAWLLSGHCAHSFDCERWKIGCGHCPALSMYPAIRRDATAYNWRRKRDIYAKSRFYVATPSRWLIQKVEQSVLAPAIVEARVIPNGVDLSVYHPEDKHKVRAELGIPQDAKVLLFAANGIRLNVWKDYQTMRTTVALVAESFKQEDVLFIALGENAPAERIGQAEIQFVPYQKDPNVVAHYYQAADVYVHAARADTFPNTVLEALACGTPVVASAVGGILEQVKGLNISNLGFRISDLNKYRMDDATGLLVPVGDARIMAMGIVALLTDTALRRQLSKNAARDARDRFDLNRQGEEYLGWYHKILEHWNVKR